MSSDRSAAASAAVMMTAALFYPLVTLFALLSGHFAELFCDPVCAALFMALAGALSVPILKNAAGSNAFIRVSVSLLPLLSVINWVLYLTGFDNYEPFLNLLTSGAMIVLFCIAGLLVIKCCRKLSVKIVFCAVPGLFALILAVISFFAAIFASIGKTEVVQAVSSPDGRYVAELIDDDQGALGGSTLVWVRRNTDVDLVVIRLKSFSQSIYTGRWGEFHDMTLEWKDDRSILINGTEYPVFD